MQSGEFRRIIVCEYPLNLIALSGKLRYVEFVSAISYFLNTAIQLIHIYMTKLKLTNFLDERLEQRKAEVVNIKQLQLDIHEKRVTQKDELIKFQATKAALLAASTRLIASTSTLVFQEELSDELEMRVLTPTNQI